MGVEMARFVGWPKTLPDLGTWFVAPCAGSFPNVFFLG